MEIYIDIYRVITLILVNLGPGYDIKSCSQDLILCNPNRYHCHYPFTFLRSGDLYIKPGIVRGHILECPN